MTRPSSPPSSLLVVPRRSAASGLWGDALGLGPGWRVAREGEAMTGRQYERIVVAPLGELMSVAEVEMRRQWLNNLATKLPPGEAVVFL